MGIGSIPARLTGDRSVRSVTGLIPCGLAVRFAYTSENGSIARNAGSPMTCHLDIFIWIVYSLDCGRDLNGL